MSAQRLLSQMNPGECCTYSLLRFLLPSNGVGTALEITLESKSLDVNNIPFQGYALPTAFKNMSYLS
eukprot:3465449-Amphidinium_carterae.1